MALSVSEMATKPRPSSDKPTITIRLTRRADPRVPRQMRFERATFLIGITSVTRVGIVRTGRLTHKVAELGHGRLTGNPVRQTELLNRRRDNRGLRFLVGKSDGDAERTARWGRRHRRWRVPRDR